MKKLLLTIRAAFYYNFNWPLYPRSSKWGAKLDYLMAEGFELEIIDQYTAKIGDEHVWIENFPYASFQRVPKGDVVPDQKFMPNLSTGYKLCKMLERIKKQQEIANKHNFEQSL